MSDSPQPSSPDSLLDSLLDSPLESPPDSPLDSPLDSSPDRRDPPGRADAAPRPAHAQALPAAGDDLFVQYERACGEVQLAGHRLQRQMQEYEALMADIRQLEACATPEAREKLSRLQTLVESAAFQREEREIARMATALVSAIERFKSDAPASATVTTAATAATAPSSPLSPPSAPSAAATWPSSVPQERTAGRSLAVRSPRA
ncbi:hypothetical protein HUS70_07005 [Pandoraea nosoerga]|uniref:Uncharacterized protein n=1 Tax=Pandoraea nosoerga TaxID=2508296 RepID=A0A5E4UTK4_9BURK|nr:hypothetical protein [Pandoraea nosoerga]MBN4666563.1 hypothetical protein [Pandoraea nosoerga]MBN4674193.1 hypothetical protein [Pandoraea nosoerga]MBN4679873.1 hypothetical protein [Pandoraea nosoerga]MBN4744412.1 hypothetical protein [Pandoraea nosoerga]VVE03302.1 hypothetical protein PNO31109_02231 [Pandoraea nosoerga]